MVANKNIKVSMNTKNILDKNKVYPRESYDDVIKRILTKKSRLKMKGGRKK